MKLFISQRKSESKSIKLKNMHILFGFNKKLATNTSTTYNKLPFYCVVNKLFTYLPTER